MIQVRQIRACTSVEWEKFFKSKIPLLTVLASSLVPFAGGFLCLF